MKKAVAVLTLFCMVAGVNFTVEARLNLLQKVGDLVKGRKSNEDTRSLDQVIGNIKGLGSNFGSSGSTQFKYVCSKFLTTDADLSFLIAYSSFARSSELFFSLLEILLSKIRIEYTTSLGAQNRLENTNSDRTRLKQENKDVASRNNMQRCLEVLTSNGFQALQANLQSSAIVLLKLIQGTGGIPNANLQTIQKQVSALCKKCSAERFSYIYGNLPSNLSSAAEISEFPEEINSKAESLINNISLVKNALDVLNRYVNGEDFSDGNRQSQIEDILSKTDYYSGAGQGADVEEEVYEEGDDE